MGNEKLILNDTPSSRLSESEANRRLEDFTRLVTNWIWEVDRDFKITFISDRVFEVLGLHPQELVGQSLDEIIAFGFSSNEELSSLLSHPFRDRPSTAKTHKGEICHLLISGLPVFNLETGDFEGMRGTANDVTARIQAENKLRESEWHYRSLIEFQRTGILVYRDYKIVFANASAVRIFGADSIEDLLGRTSLELTHPNFHDLIKKGRIEVEKNNSVQDFMELIHFRIDGSEFYALDNAASILWENESAVLVSVSDISETKDAERAAALSEIRFKQFAESAADIFWESDAEHRYSFISPLPANFPALAKDFPIGLTPWETEALKPSDVDWANHRSVLDAHKPFRNFQYEVIDTMGNTRYLSRNGTPQFNEKGEFSGYRGTIIDETEHVLARKKIATIQHQFFTAIDNFSEGFALWGPDGNFVYCNSYYKINHLGAQEHLLPGKNYRDFIRAYAISVNIKQQDGLDNWIQRRVDEFSPDSTTKELFLDDKWIKIRKHRLTDGSAMAIYSDITDQREQEKALQSSEDRLHLITNAIPAMIAYHDLDMRFEFANKNFETLGLDPNEIIGKTVEDVFPPDIYAKILPNIEKTLAGESVTYENFFPTQDGEGIITQVSLIPDFDYAGEVRGLFVLSFDITERKTAEEEIEKSNMALDAAQSIAKIGSWERDFSSNYMTWSEEHYRIFGLEPASQTIAVRQFLDLIHPNDRDTVTNLIPHDFKQIESDTPEESALYFDEKEYQLSLLTKALDEMTKREREIFIHRRLNEDKTSLGDLGQLFQISPERVRQIEHSVFAKIQKIVTAEHNRIEAMTNA